MILYKVFYTNRFIPERFAGKNYGPVTFIRPQYKDDKGLHAHEKVHARQWYRGIGIIYALRYRFSKTARLMYEVEAYREQLKYSPGHKTTFARYIATKYGLDISTEDAIKLLSEE